jgi:integrase
VAPRPRRLHNLRLPPNLRERDGYFSWRNPLDGREHGLGRDRQAAIAQAVEANLHVQGLASSMRLVDRLTGSDDRTVDAFSDLYEKLLAKRKLADNTRRTNKSLLKRTRAALGGAAAIERITTLDVSAALSAVVEEGKARTAQAWRSFLADYFRHAVAIGWIQTNPVLVTEKVSVEIQRARLTLEVFKAVRDAAGDWLRNAMNLAIVTAQRREEICSARFADFRDGGWFCEQKKTGNRVFIPLEIRLHDLALSLEDVVRDCRRTGAVSKYLVHQTKPYGNSPVGSRIWVDTISRRFTDTLATLGLDWGGKSPPTFHEIRSLSERLYAAQGGVNTQELLGHRDARMTQVYHDARGAEWVRVKIAF